ncbi:MAG: hypothetical protein J6N70_14010 [Oribacterium sp.]|nr:hypothetical protein [Oribacterium sp.]
MNTEKKETGENTAEKEPANEKELVNEKEPEKEPEKPIQRKYRLRSETGTQENRMSIISNVS